MVYRVKEFRASGALWMALCWRSFGRSLRRKDAGWREASSGGILREIGAAQNFGLDAGVAASRLQQAAYFRGLKLGDLVLARACATGKERAWERFVAIYRAAACAGCDCDYR